MEQSLKDSPVGYTQQTSDPNRQVLTRRIDFEPLIESMPKYPAGNGDVLSSHLFAVLSATFPEGEEFFLRSVRRFRSEITDPSLKSQVAGFIGQESVHGREHRSANEKFAEYGYPTLKIDRRIKRLLGLVEKVQSPLECLAITAAIEHFTASMAELVMSNEAARAQLGDGAVGKIALWHALEESEHKAVAFDVYKAVGGSEKVRIRTMKRVRKAFFFRITIEMINSVMRDKQARKISTLRHSWKHFKNSPLLSKKLRQMLKEYDKIGFHPNDRDTSGLEALWRDKFFGDEGELSYLLKSAA